jgi:hypothetical protein
LEIKREVSSCGLLLFIQLQNHYSNQSSLLQDSAINMPEDQQLITVYTASGQPEAEIIKGRLESEGIPAILRYESAGIVYGLTVNGLGQVEIQVPSSLVQEASAIVATDESDAI